MSDNKRLLFEYNKWRIYDYPEKGKVEYVPSWHDEKIVSDVWHLCNPSIGYKPQYRYDPSPCYQTIGNNIWKCFSCGRQAPPEVVAVWTLQNFEAIQSRGPL